MKFLVSSFVFVVGALSADPCSRLCQFDGPQICTGGSWTKGNDICHAYYYNTDGHCYHTALTKTTCPASGRPVKGSEVEGLIAARRGGDVGRTSTTAAPSNIKAATTRGSVGLVPARGRLGGSFTTTIEPTIDSVFPIDPSEFDVSDLVDTPENANGNTLIRLIVRAFPRPEAPTDMNAMSFFISEAIFRTVGNRWKTFVDTVSEFKRLKGSLLLNMAAREEACPAVTILPFLLGMDIAMRDPMSRERFAEESGFNRFYELFPEKLLQAFLTLHEHIKKDRVRDPSPRALIAAEVLSCIPAFFPGLLESSLELRMALGVTWLWWDLPVEPRTRGLTIRASRASAFSDAVAQITQASPLTLRALIDVTLREEGATGPGARREWFSLAFESVFRTDGHNALFHIREDGRYVLRTTASAEQYSLLGRFLAMCVVNEEPVGVKFPLIYIARLLGVQLTLDDFEKENPDLARPMRVVLNAPQETLGVFAFHLNGEVVYPTVENRELLIAGLVNEISSPEVEGKLNIVVEAFQSVVVQETLSTILNVTDLANWFFGAPRINVEEMIEVMDRGTVQLLGIRAPVTDWLFEHLRTMDQAGLRRFYRWITGSSVVPFGGFASLNPAMHIALEGNSEKLPQPSTGFRRLHLPRYESKAILVARLTLAMT